MWRFSQHQLKLQKSALHAEERVINPLKAIQTLSLTQMLNMQNSNQRGLKSAAIYLRITHTFSCCALHLASRLNYLHLWSFRLQSISQSSTILSLSADTNSSSNAEKELDITKEALSPPDPTSKVGIAHVYGWLDRRHLKMALCHRDSPGWRRKVNLRCAKNKGKGGCAWGFQFGKTTRPI